LSAITQLWPDGSKSPDLALLFAAVQAFPGSLAVVDSGTVLYANPAWAQLFQHADPAQIQGRAVKDFIPHHDFQPPVPGRIDPEDPHSGGELSQPELQVVSTSFRMRGKEFQVVSARNTGPNPHAETEWREAQGLEVVGRLAGGVAHDFNNLLTGIMLYCDLLMAELEKDSRSRLHAREIRRAGEHGAELVRQLLTVARPQAPESRMLALNEAVRGIEDLLTRLVGENVVLTMVLANDLGPVRMDPVHVQQILLNLVLNARDAMPQGGRITLATRNCTECLVDGRQEGDAGGARSRPVPCVELTVSDTGCGMDEETLKHAFEPFFTTKTAGRGNGLGLSTACRLAKLEGGTIAAESQPGRGTRVSLRLPRANPAGGHESPNPGSTSAVSESSERKGSGPGLPIRE
jgi:signal transduction histidine kinase